jgi:O-antigen ligase/tetratricopeptide (TPR) repeat protein
VAIGPQPPAAGASAATQPRPPAGFSRVLAWIGIVLGIIYLTFGGGGGSLGIYVVQWRIASLVMIAIALLAWLAAAVRDPAWRPRTVLWPAFAASLVAFAISSATSRNPRLSLEYAAYAVICTALYLLLVRLLADPWFRSRLGGLTVLLTLAIGAYYLALVLAHWIYWWSAVGRITVPPLRPASESLTYGNPSAVATMMLLLCAASLAHLGAGTGRRRLLDALLVILTAAVVLLTGSRGAWLGVGIAVVALAALLVLLPQFRLTLRSLAARRTARYGAVLVALVLVAAALALFPALRDRLLTNTLTSRLSFYVAALRTFETAPLLGSGPGTWVARRIAFTDPSGVDYYIPHAHDIYLQTLAEFGLLGVVAGAVVIATLAWLLLSAIRGGDPVRRRYGWAAAFSLVYLAGHQLVDFYANMPAVFFALGLTVGTLDATSGPLPRRFRLPIGVRRLPGAFRLPTAPGPRMRTMVRRTFPVLVVAALAFSAWSESVALTQYGAVTAADQGHWATALADAQAVAAADPNMPPYQFTLGIAAAGAGQLTLARDAFTREARADDFPEAWLDLAAVQLRLGNGAAARADLDRAMRLGAQQPVVAVAAASLYLRLGDSAAASGAIADTFALVPQLAADPYWSSAPALRAAAERALGPAMASRAPFASTWVDPTTVPYQIALAAGQTAEAERLAAALPSTQQAVAELVIRAWNGDRSALGALVARVVAHPLDGEVAGPASLLAQRLGEMPIADRMAKIAAQGGALDGPAQNEILIGLSCGTCAQMPGANAPLYGFFTYRRPVPADLLVLDLPRLAYR